LAFILAIFLGQFGAHRFFLRKDLAIFQLLLTLTGWVLILISPNPFGLHLRDCGTIGYRDDCQPDLLQNGITATYGFGVAILALVGVWVIYDLTQISKWVSQRDSR
jgi:hypothetical protein